MSRLKSALLLCLWAAFAASSCQRVDESATAPPPRQDVVFKHYFSFAEPYAGNLASIAKDFNAGDIRYSLRPMALPHEAFKTAIREELRKHRTADIYSYWAGARVQSIVGALQPVDDAFPAEEMNRLFGPSVVASACTYDGRLYFVPIAQHFVGFFYNKKRFAELGLAPPRTWDELLHQARQLKARGITPFALGAKARWPAQFWFDYLLLRTAPLEYRQRLMAGEASFDDPEVVRVFSMWRELLAAGFFNADPNQQEFHSGAGMQVRRGEAAMTLMGTWLMGYLESPEVGWNEGEDYGFFPFPQIDPKIPTVALGPIDGLVLPKDARNPDGAKAAMRHLAKAGSQASISRAMGSIAPNLLVLDRHYSPLKLAIRGEIAQAHAWAFNYDLATAPERAEIGLNLFSAFLDAPDQYRSLLKKTAAQMAAVHAAEGAPAAALK